MKKRLKLFSTFILISSLVGVVSCNNDNPNSNEVSSIETSSNQETSSNNQVKDEYSVTYNLNYEGAQDTRVVTVKNGKRATNWKATRPGYSLVGWYTDAACTEESKFDFSNYVTSDLVLYAKWLKDAAKYTVTFNFNYEGNQDEATVTAEEGKTISTGSIPECSRLGFEYEGWYLDKECTQKWNFESDTISGDLTLYAKYQFDSSIPRNDDGSIKYENVSVNIWIGSDFGCKTYFDTLAKQFNKDHLDEITVNITTTLDQQDKYSLRVQQVPGVNNTYTTYYPAMDVMSLAGVSFDASDFYSEAIRENYVSGTLYTIPLVGSIPYIVYNKELMTKYNTYDHLPSNYTEFLTVLKAAYEGESTTNPSFTSIVTNGSWTFKEATSQAAFLQNDAEYYVYKDGQYVNTWGDDNTNAKTAINNFYELLGFGGQAHGSGGVSVNEYYDTTAVDNVVNKASLLGIVNMGVASNSSVMANSNAIGVLPLSGLFADADKQNANQIPYHQISIEFFKAKDVSMTQIAAGALFVDYVSKNTASFAKSGFYPLRKSIVESAEFKDSANPNVKFLKQVGDPNNFRTLDGHSSEKPIMNVTVAETFLPEVYYWENKDQVATLAEQIKQAINGQL